MKALMLSLEYHMYYRFVSIRYIPHFSFYRYNSISDAIFCRDVFVLLFFGRLSFAPMSCVSVISSFARRALSAHFLINHFNHTHNTHKTWKIHFSITNEKMDRAKWSQRKLHAIGMMSLFDLTNLISVQARFCVWTSSLKAKMTERKRNERNKLWMHKPINTIFFVYMGSDEK